MQIAMTLYIGCAEWPSWEDNIARLRADGWTIQTQVQQLPESARAGDIVLPMSLRDMRAWASHASAFCPPAGLVELLDDKYAFVLWMLRSGFAAHVPTLFSAHIGGVCHQHSPATARHIVKKVRCSGAEGSYISSPSPSSNSIPHIDGDSVTQRYIHGLVEYGSHFCVKNGTVVHSVCFAMPCGPDHISRGRMTGHAKVSQPCPALFSRLFKCLNYHGFACINFKMENGVPMIFEINPRLGGTVVHDMHEFQNMIHALLK